jgi:hypothetical protein
MGRKSPPRCPGTGKYEVGYGKPPKDTQFKPGQSGNPKGYKKHVKSLKTLRQPKASLAGDFGYSRKCRHFRRLAAKSPVPGEEYRASRAEGRDFQGESLLDDFSISEIWIGSRPEIGCVSAGAQGTAGVGSHVVSQRDRQSGTTCSAHRCVLADACRARRDPADRPAKAEFTTIRERLIKIGARVIEHIARIRIQLPTSCPEGALFRAVAFGLMPSAP